MSSFSLSVLFFFQVAFILAVCRLVGIVAKKIGQPQVVGEMIAGVLMGPSLFGLLLPGVHSQLFPKESMTIIFAVCQIGLVLYMFLVGLEFQTELIRRRIRTAAAVSMAGIAVPFILGATMAVFMTGDGVFFGEKVVRWEAMLFLGAAMSITAFPMLARIIYERGMTGTMLGTLALAAGSIDDAAAWCLLALVLASFSSTPSIAVIAIGGGVLYVAFTLTVGKRLLTHVGRKVEREGSLSAPMFSFVLMLVMLGAWFTDAIQIYAVFGAFILGAAMPRGLLAHELTRRIEPLTVSFLLPLFFVYSGLNTRIGLVDTPYLWAVTLFVMVAASVGKGVACWLAARLNGETQRDALGVGALMNARGLMELIILNIGLQKGVITPTLFAIMVIMAIGTTLMSSPVFELVYRRPSKAEPVGVAGPEFEPGVA